MRCVSTIQLDLLELFGSGYAIDFCISAFLEKRKEELYRIYVTDALKEYLKLNIRYADLFKPQETRTAKEIISGISEKLTRLGGIEE